MSPRNVFLSVAGVLIVVVLAIVALLWQPVTNSLLVTLGGAEANNSEVAVSHSPGAQTVKEDNHYVSIIHYDGDAFAPLVLVINRGENVRFVNTSNIAMRVQAVNTSTTTQPNEYQQADSVGNGGTYELSFVNPGVWLVTDLNNLHPDQTMAVVYVK